jgi:hypothetical protein
MTLSRLDESDEDDIVAVQTSARQFSFIEHPPIPIAEPLGPQVCIACGSCEMYVAGLNALGIQFISLTPGSMMAG